MDAFCIKEQRGCSCVFNICCWEGRCNVNETGILYLTIMNSSNMEGRAHGILQDSSHRETVRIGGMLRGNIITEMQVSSFETSIPSGPTLAA